MRNTAIEVSSLTKRFGSFVAVNHIGFRVESGSIFGLLGANGAGKTTTIRMLCGLLAADEGSAVLDGIDVMAAPEAVKRRIGYMSQRFSLYRDLSVDENLEFFAGLYGAPAAVDRSERLNRIAAVGLAGRENDLAEGGTTVVVTTHYLDEAEYCDQIVMMHAGGIVASGGPGELKERVIPGVVLEVEGERVMELTTHLAAETWILETALFGDSLHVQVQDGIGAEEAARRLAAAASDFGFSRIRVEPIVPSLEDVFLRVLERV
ncbi:MAG: ABC transporter ATP-binding protein [Spirochaetaceae bacterium]|nr:ABC transporter ATP-binding protein [Spirochaetaceae bacterium]MDT8297786.1 ABC transporter ATP-binding protein [Spirochaetaceae bacterium]